MSTAIVTVCGAGGGYTQGARVYNDADISIRNAEWDRLYFNSERYDTDNIHIIGEAESASGKYEYYDTGDDNATVISGVNWRTQTFIALHGHKITSVKLLLYRVLLPGTLTVSIRKTDASGHPTGSDLCSGTTNSDTLTTDPAGEWREITLGAGYWLAGGYKYAIVVRALTGDGSNYVCWRLDATAPTYTRGQAEYSSNSGSSWTAYADSDCMFEEWGTYILSERLTCQTAGIYLVSLHITYVQNVTGQRACAIKTSHIFPGEPSYGYFAHMGVQAVTAGDNTTLSVSSIIQMEVGEYLTAVALQASGGALVIAYDPPGSPEFMMQRIG